ncbi:energy transducer TonB [Derxia gummosa]|uniref:Energy transducer TonB n=1 Tax=Derxia gummosa DSM 723 TaxID=1121388 RepID=A0A8B6X890_9BURK|nr:TonB family protein [Derxia gummosa]
MTQTLSAPRRFDPRDWYDRNRVLAAAIALSFLLHGGLLTVRFVAPETFEIKAKDPGIEVVIVNSRSDRAPAQAELLAQVALDGGGEHDSKHAGTPLPNTGVEQPGNSLNDAVRKLQQLEAEQKKLLSSLTRDGKPTPAPSDAPRPTPDPRNGADMTDAQRAYAQQAAIVQERIDMENKRPRKHFFGTGAKDYSAALYVENFRSKVEKWGNSNYPEEARGKVYGAVQITVLIDGDGNIVELNIDKSSGHKLLDQSALNIVRRAAPYGRFTAQMKKEMDQLSITRTMMFTNDQFETRAK